MNIPTKSHTGLHHDLRRRAPNILLEPCLMLDPSVPDCGGDGSPTRPRHSERFVIIE